MTLLRTRTPLAELLAEQIRARGPMPFAEYMEQCLYHPQHGYYSRAEAQRFADYYTSVDVHPIFGRTIARQLDEMWRQLGRPEKFFAVECGAETGRLASHILDFCARRLPEFYAALEYVAVERSEARRAAAAQRLRAHAERGRFSSQAELPGTIPSGCIFSNEFFDALPVHRLMRQGGELGEIFVGWKEDAFVEVLEPTSTPRLAAYFRSQGIALCEGQQAEAGVAAMEWMENAGRRLQRGFVLTVDYGHEAAELYNERHQRGTLLAYSRHRADEDFYAAPGEQDLTAHVNFTALLAAGERSGLQRTGCVSQSRFLLAWGRQNDFSDLFDEEQTEVERLRARLLLKTLIFPEGMGETFRVLVQHKGVEAPAFTGLAAF
jgi:SAM-dependent MidA family methyltransferase